MSDAELLNEKITRHYSRRDLGPLILEALARAGKDIDNLMPEELAPMDEFHVRGREATMELAAAVGLEAGMCVLDVGSGIGGPARRIAREFGCRVTGVDLADEYCSAATLLTERVGLSRLVDFRQGDALHLPFADGTFDVVWTQHVGMNIPDKGGLYREMRRVLKPGGALAIYDVLAGPAPPVLFPVPWARSDETSFLVTPEELRHHLQASGFTITGWEDTTEAAKVWFARLAVNIREKGLPLLGIHLLLGDEFRAMARNQRVNLEEGRVVLAQVVARRQ